MPQRIHINFGYFQLETVQPERPVSDKARAVLTIFRWPCVTASFLTPMAASATGACCAGQGVVFSNPPQLQSGVEGYSSPMQGSPPARHRLRHKFSSEGGGTSQ